MYHRYLESLFLEPLTEFRILYLTGPRQAGKTTLVRSIANRLNMTYLTLDNKAVLASARQDPHGLVRSTDNLSVIIDEFQYAPELIRIFWPCIFRRHCFLFRTDYSPI